MVSTQSFGGRATAIILRQKALDNYYANPRPYWEFDKGLLKIS